MAENIISDLYLKIPRRIKILIAFILIILVAYFFVRIITPDPKNIPEEFLRAKQQSALIAKEIVDISGQTSDNIKDISELDKQQKYEEALKLVSQEIEHNRQAREKAISLSNQLEIMAKNISAIQPLSLSQAAVQAVSYETTLISRLISYNDYLVQLLEILKNKFSGEEKNADGKIAELITKINTEAQTINDLNDQFNSAMEKISD